MDSVTQIVLGAAVAGVIAPRSHRRKAIVLGAALGTLPDLDVFIDYGGAVSNFTYHRGFSHSLFVLAPLSVMIWLGLRRWWGPVRGAPGRWFAAIFTALITHPLLDAHTAYGTQLWWPVPSPPVSWSTIFIIDPTYTVPLLVAVAGVFVRPKARWGGYVLLAGLLISSSYLGLSWLGKHAVEKNARLALQEVGLEKAPVFSVPTPFNTLLWRVVVLTDEGYLEGFDSLVADDGSIRFSRYPSDTRSLEAASDIWAVARLRWFSQDFLKSEVSDDVLVLTDLRMGQEPEYVFSYAVATRGNPHWHEIETRQLPQSFGAGVLTATWKRIWGAD